LMALTSKTLNNLRNEAVKMYGQNAQVVLMTSSIYHAWLTTYITSKYPFKEVPIKITDYSNKGLMPKTLVSLPNIMVVAHNYNLLQMLKTLMQSLQSLIIIITTLYQPSNQWLFLLWPCTLITINIK